MRWSKYFIPTLREVPKDAEIESHRLMLRAGMIHKVSAGLYAFLPLGLRVIKKICGIIREELGRRGAVELEMPVLQPKEIWEQSGRWDAMGPLMMKLKNREDKEFVLGPTHEEIITHITAAHIRSYKDLPKNFYQIQTKFRDEIRPRFGVIRAKEFLMKDGYSFHTSAESAEDEYRNMYEAYKEIFKRCGINAKAVEADTGVMGGNRSHEFTVPAAKGEDIIAECSVCGYTANLELAERAVGKKEGNGTKQDMCEIDTPGMKKVEELARFFKCGRGRFIKTLIYKAGGRFIAALTAGDVDVSGPKLARALNAGTAELAGEGEIEEVTGAPVGFAGPVGLKIPVIADESIRGMTNAVTGANKKDKHIKNVNIGRDFTADNFFDIGTAKEGDLCRRCGGRLSFSRGIEVGQIFRLGTKYSEKLGAVYQDEKGQSLPMIMGCYGIGVSRTVAAVIECNNDGNGIIWPEETAPFSVLILPINYSDKRIREAADRIYAGFEARGIDTLLDDRDETAGIKFKDSDLIGIPVKVIIGKGFLETGDVEIKYRRDNKKKQVKEEDVYDNIIGKGI